jgi:peptidoglycan/LPS O-acetylase OafA/YrhL
MARKWPGSEIKMSAEMFYNKNLEGLRGIAALIVVFSHASNYFIMRGDVQFALDNINKFNLRDYILIALFNCRQGAGQIGVMIFFALSSFLLVSQHLLKGFEFLEAKKVGLQMQDLRSQYIKKLNDKSIFH